jgi:hypothetical protein
VRRGYAVNVTSNQAGTALLEVSVDGRVLAAGRVRIGRKSAKLTANRKTRIRAAIARSRRAALRKRKSVKLVLKVTVTNAAGKKAVVTRKVTVKA